MARMQPFALRRLAAGERALAVEMFGRGLDTGRVRLLALPLWSRAFVAGPRLMVWPARQAWRDFSAAPVALQAVFVHELTHVWQAQRGVGLLRAKLKAGDSAASYAYDLAHGPEFTRLNIEQQAMVVQHAFESAHGLAAPHPPELYAQASADWRASWSHVLVRIRDIRPCRPPIFPHIGCTTRVFAGCPESARGD